MHDMCGVWYHIIICIQFCHDMCGVWYHIIICIQFCHNMCGVWYNIDGDVASCWLSQIADQLDWCSTLFLRIAQLTKCVCHWYICYPSHQIYMSTDLHISSSCQHVPSHLCMIHCNFMIWLGVCLEVDCAGCAHACFNSNSHALLITFTNLLSSIITTHIMHHGFFCTHWVWSFPYTCASTTLLPTWQHKNIPKSLMNLITFLANLTIYEKTHERTPFHSFLIRRAKLEKTKL